MQNVPISGSDFEILGVTICRAGPVRSVIHLELNEGVTALYGINGVGKSQVLAMVADALRGVTPEPDRPAEPSDVVLDVHIRLCAPLQDALGGDVSNLSFLGATIADQIRWLSGGARVRTNPTPLLEQLVAASAHKPGTGAETLAAWAQAAKEGRLTLRATGTDLAPRWEVYLSCSPSAATTAPLLEREDSYYGYRNTGSRKGLDPAFHVALAYWGHDGNPRWASDMSRALQVPSMYIGTVSGPLTYHEVRRGLPERTTHLIRDEEAGFRLAKLAGNVATTADADASTLERLFEASGSHLYGVYSQDEGLDEEIQDEIRRRELRATELIGQVLVDRPVMTFDMLTPDWWVRGKLPRWRVNGWDFPHLSEAQRRWASLAASLADARPASSEWSHAASAHDPYAGVPVVFLCDEPEAGLHRLAEHRLAAGLNAMMRITSAGALVASHSPDLLSSRLVRNLFVTRDPVDDGVQIRPLDVTLTDSATARESAEALGLAVGDLLALARVSVIVEGVHDEWVFKNLLADELDAAPAGILPMHGATRLRSLAEARLLMDGTDSQILVVLDDLNHHEASEALAAVRKAFKQGEAAALEAALDHIRVLGKRNDSFLFIHQFALRAVELGNIERIAFFGLSLPDVICYLDPAAVLLEARPWEELAAEWTLEASPAPPKNIKGWLKSKGLLPADPSAVDEAIERAAIQARFEGQPIHPDLVALGLRISELAGDHPYEQS